MYEFGVVGAGKGADGVPGGVDEEFAEALGLDVLVEGGGCAAALEEGGEAEGGLVVRGRGGGWVGSDVEELDFSVGDGGAGGLGGGEVDDAREEGVVRVEGCVGLFDGDSVLD